MVIRMFVISHAHCLEYMHRISLENVYQYALLDHMLMIIILDVWMYVQ
jgi:hypothetical protein